MIKTAMLVTTLSCATALAAPSASAMETSTKQDLTALSTIAVATAAAGPVGFVIGSVGASWLAQQVADADQYAVADEELTSAQREIARQQAALDTLTTQLDSAQTEQRRFARMALDQLQLELLFTTGRSELTRQGRERLALLGTFLNKNPDLNIDIEGFADPRGDTAANLALSRARARQVAAALSEEGVSQDRMEVIAHGESRSTSPEGDYDAYALERVVRIELKREHTNHQVAEVTLTDGVPR